MLDIREGAGVTCTDGEAGEVFAVVIDPVQQQMTHIVVMEGAHWHRTERLVPISAIAEAADDRVQLSCTRAELAAMDAFVKTRYVQHASPDYGMLQGGEYMAPYAIDMSQAYDEIEVEAVPPGELALHRGFTVNATDGHAGTVGEFIVHPKTGHITHFVLQEGHLWYKREVAIPISHIQSVTNEQVVLDLDKSALQALPEPSLERAYPQE